MQTSSFPREYSSLPRLFVPPLDPHSLECRRRAQRPTLQCSHAVFLRQLCLPFLVQFPLPVPQLKTGRNTPILFTLSPHATITAPSIVDESPNTEPLAS
jgi:hypothetical protein